MQKATSILTNIIDNVEKVIVGKRSAIELILVSFICKGHVIIEDVPGVGKTSMVSAISKSLACSFKRIQFTPDIMPSDITGFSIYNQGKGCFEFRKGSIMSQIILADEINRTSPKTQASLLEVMEENHVTVDGITHDVPLPFMVLATQNPVEYIGTYPLPEAQMDRFFIKISLGYPTPEDENLILKRYQNLNHSESLTPVASPEEIMTMQEEVTEIHIDDTLSKYIINIVNQTRKHEDILLGASPRGTIALMKASKAWAFLQNRSYVVPEDITKMIKPVLLHRIVLRQEAKLKKATSYSILQGIIDNTMIPVVDYYEKK
jgi:MoxR-like ATPase